MRRFELLLRIVVPCGAVVATLLAVELLLRVPGAEGFMDFEPTLRTGPLVYLPNQEARHRLGREIDTVIRINSRGFRDEEFAVASGTRTAVALGDSFTEGWGVDLGEAWPKQLERRLSDAETGYSHVYNAGHNGTNPKNYAAVYREFFKRDPCVGLVVVGFCLLNDIVEAQTPARLRTRTPGFSSQVKFFLSKYSVLYNLSHRSLRYSAQLEKLMSKLGLTNPPPIMWDIQSNDTNRRRWPYTTDFLAALGSSIQAEGRQFLLVLIPPKELVLDDYFETLLKYSGAPASEIDRFGFRDYAISHLPTSGIRVLDLTPVFRNAGNRSELYFHGDGHWSAAGHRLAAETIEAYLHSSGLIPLKASPPAGANSQPIRRGAL